MEGGVYVCSWKREGDEYLVWVKNRRKLTARGSTFEEADEALWSVIITATGDGENVREYDPPAPTAPAVAELLNPALVLIGSNSSAHTNDPELFDGERCQRCGLPAGNRTDKPLTIDIDGSADASFVVVKHGAYASTWRYLYSEAFLDLLDAAERAAFSWRQVQRPGRARNGSYHDLALCIDVPKLSELRPLFST